MKRWIRVEDDTIVQIAYLDKETPELLNKVKPGVWVNVGDFEVPNSNYDNAQEGGVYDSENDICRPPKPYDSWIASGNTWVAPVAPPNDDATGLVWKESAQEWVAETD